MVDGYKLLFGGDHRITLEAKIKLAEAEAALGYFDRTSELYENVLQNHEATLGARHPSTLQTKFVWGKFKWETKRDWAGASKLVRAAIEGAETQLGPGHPTLQDYRSGLIKMKMEAG